MNKFLGALVVLVCVGIAVITGKQVDLDLDSINETLGNAHQQLQTCHKIFGVEEDASTQILTIEVNGEPRDFLVYKMTEEDSQQVAEISAGTEIVELYLPFVIAPQSVVDNAE